LVMVDLSHVLGEAEKLPQRLLEATCDTNPGRGASASPPLVPHERSIGDRLLACGDVGPRILPLLGGHRLGNVPRAFIRSCCWSVSSAMLVSSLEVRVGYLAVQLSWPGCGFDTDQLVAQRRG
jgi:hypothetical protein